jgi:hypothetical protein
VRKQVLKGVCYFVTEKITLNVVAKRVKDYFIKKSYSYYNKQTQSEFYFSIKSVILWAMILSSLSFKISINYNLFMDQFFIFTFELFGLS